MFKTFCLEESFCETVFERFLRIVVSFTANTSAINYRERFLKISNPVSSETLHSLISNKLGERVFVWTVVQVIWTRRHSLPIERANYPTVTAVRSRLPTCYYGSTHLQTGYCRRRYCDSRYASIAADRSPSRNIDRWCARRRTSWVYTRPPTQQATRRLLSMLTATRNRKRAVDRRSRRKLTTATDSNATHDRRTGVGNMHGCSISEWRTGHASVRRTIGTRTTNSLFLHLFRDVLAAPRRCAERSICYIQF